MPWADGFNAELNPLIPFAIWVGPACGELSVHQVLKLRSFHDYDSKSLISSCVCLFKSHTRPMNRFHQWRHWLLARRRYSLAKVTYSINWHTYVSKEHLYFYYNNRVTDLFFAISHQFDRNDLFYELVYILFKRTHIFYFFFLFIVIIRWQNCGELSVSQDLKLRSLHDYDSKSLISSCICLFKSHTRLMNRFHQWKHWLLARRRYFLEKVTYSINLHTYFSKEHIYSYYN